MRTISIMNQKGGVGKTTSSINIGAGLAKLGRKVLLLDLDPQAHLSYSLGLQAHELPSTMYEVLRGKTDLSLILVEKDGLWIAPSSLNLSAADIELASLPGREFLLLEALENVKGYDVLLVDCPPNLGLLSINAMTATREIFIPLQTEFLALQSLGKILETVQTVKRRLNKHLEVTGIICTRYSRQKRLNREVVQKIQEYFGDKLFETKIRENIALAEAPSFGQDIFHYRPDSHGAEDYLSLCKEIIQRGES